MQTAYAVFMIDLIFENLGGTVAMAKGLGLPLPTVSSWKQRGRIPDWYHDKIVKLAAQKNISLSRDDFYRQ